MLRQEQQKSDVTLAMGVNATGEAVYLDFAAAIVRYGKEQAFVKGHDENDDAVVRSSGKRYCEGEIW